MVERTKNEIQSKASSSQNPAFKPLESKSSASKPAQTERFSVKSTAQKDKFDPYPLFVASEALNSV